MMNFPFTLMSKLASPPAGTIVQNGTAVSNVVGATGILPAMTWGTGDLVCVVAFGATGNTVITGASGGGGALNTWSRMYDGGAGGNTGVHSSLNQQSDGTGNDIDCWAAVANAPGSAQVITVSGSPFGALVGFVLSNVNTATQHTGGSPGVDAITQALNLTAGSITPSPVTVTQTSQVLLLCAASNDNTDFTGTPTGYTTIINGNVNVGSTYQTDFYAGLQTSSHIGSGTISPGSLTNGGANFASSDTIALV